MVNTAATHEPPPLQERADQPHIADMVCHDIMLFTANRRLVEDIKARKAEGMKKYGTPLQPFNGRDTFNDLYQEVLDALNYMRQYIHEEVQKGSMHSSILDQWNKEYQKLINLADMMCSRRSIQGIYK